MELSNGKKWLIGIGVVSTLLLAYAAISIKKQVDLAKKIKFDLVSIKPLIIALKEIGFKITMSIQNVSDLNIDINGIDLDVYANGIFVNKVRQNQRQVVHAQSTNKFSFNVYMNPLDVLKDVKVSDLTQALDYKNIKLKMKGTVTGTIDGISFSNLPIDEDYLVSDFL